MRLLPLLLAAACLAAQAAFGQTQQDYQAQAIAKHPELKNPTSPLSKAVAAEVAKRRKANSAFFTAADWQVRLADELALAIPPDYKLVDRSFMSNGLHKIILIDPADATRARLLLLGKSFHEDTKRILELHVAIYDDAKAARMAAQNKKPNPPDLAHLDHRVAYYIRSPDTGEEFMRLHRPGSTISDDRTAVLKPGTDK
ncbi:MAG: hypothetical protein JWO08_2705 [Verrucomicrobiaceae bacterium]|nr:hypothetical protein [Verrucomicrobiaceae bacterium]